MARRKKSAGDNGCAVVGIAVVGIVVLIVRFVSEHPVASLAGGTVVIGVTIWGVVLWRQKQAREARQAWELEVARSQEIARYHAMAPDEFERAPSLFSARGTAARKRRSPAAPVTWART
ncbi:hypothetical protein [Amycolatopsis solani]|uniref:hypothetical protein n=1 Tax=Amycolatopsis solani TaxID=3028615 RepID=UPI0025B0D374|nr:hypothetical protein [Amycolatopsis sp. MEP2-6]